MRGRGIGSYRLGDRYVTPDRKMSEMLTQQGSRGGPSNSWQETMGRIAQQLAGAYIGYKDQKNQNVANQAFAKVQPDSFRPPTDAEAMATPGMRDLELAAMSGMAGDGQGQTVTAPLPDDQLMQQGGIPGTMDKISRYNAGLSGDSNRSTDDIMGDQALNAGIDLQAQNFQEEMEQLRAASNVPRPRDFKAELAQGMQGYQQDPNNRIMNEKKPQLEYAMQNLRGLENNPYAQRLLQGLMMNQMDTNAASRLAGTARDQKLADAARSRGFAVEDAARDRGYAVEDRDKRIGSTAPKSQEKFLANGLVQNQSYIGGEWVDDGEPYDKNLRSVASQNQAIERKSFYNQGGTPPSGQPQQTGGTPTGRPPWETMNPKEQDKMRKSVYTDASKMLEKNRQSLVSNKTMSDSFKRFAYLNDKQDKEAEKDYFGTKTGSFIDRMPLGGLMTLDDDKREMEKISSLLTPQMRQGMPGAASDRDVAMFANATVGIDTPKGINDSLIAGMNARFENANDRQAFMEEFLTQNKHLNGAEQEWRGYLETNPIFDPDPALEGQYVLNKNRMGYKEHFSNKGRRKGEPNNGWSMEKIN